VPASQIAVCEAFIQSLGAVLANFRLCRAPVGAFAPELSYGRHRGPVGPGARAAAVVLLLYPWRGEWHLPLILRPESMSDHGGQISLPGGRGEPGESAEQCALRELSEELGVMSDDVTVLGQLASIVVYASNYLVTPFVATSAVRPQFEPNASEVQELYEVPLAHVLDDRCRESLTVEQGHLRFRAPSIVFQGRHIWGATGVILGQFAEMLLRESGQF
jgi:8-oxo-dGTP pyrophosphatase MutT (NUDIX family)